MSVAYSLRDTSWADRKWGGYARISSDPTDERGGVTRQDEDVLASILRLGGTAPEPAYMEIENDTSAFKKRRVTITDQYGETRIAWRVVRPGYGRQLRRLRAGEIDALMVDDLDRLARDPYDLEDAIEAVEHYGALILSATAGDVDLTTDAGIAWARTLVNMANKSSRDTSRRVTRENLQRAQKGIPVGGSRPFGFAADKIHHEPTEAKLIREAAADVIAGTPLEHIAKRWHAAGVPTVRGGVWRAQTVRQILTSPRLAGWRIHQRKVATDKNGQPVKIAGATPILDQDTFDRLQEAIGPRVPRKRVDKRRGARQYLLSGVIRCGHCMKPMYGAKLPPRLDGSRSHMYTCHGTHADKHTNSVSGEPVDALIERLLLERLREESFDMPAQAFPGQSELDEVEAEIASLMEQMRSRGPDRLRREFGVPLLNDAAERRDELKAQRADYIAATVGPSVAEMTPARWVKLGDDIPKRRAFLEKLISAIVVERAPERRGTPWLDPSRIEIVWRNATKVSPDE